MTEERSRWGDENTPVGVSSCRPSLLPPLPPRNFVVVGAEIEKEEEEEGKGGREGEKEGGKDAIPIEEVGEGLREGGEGRVEVVEEGGNQACRGKGKRWSKNQNYQIN